MSFRHLPSSFICTIGLAIAIFSSSNSFGQENQETMALDSQLEVSSESEKDLVKLSDSTQLADSTKEAVLLEQLEGLKSYEKSKRERIQLEIDSFQAASKRRKERIKNQVDSLRNNTVGVPVIFEGDTLFSIFSKLGPYSASERAQSILNRIDNILDEPYSSEHFIIFNGEESSDLFYNDLVVLSITDRDAFWFDQSREELVITYKDIIDASIVQHLKDTSLINILWRIGVVLFVIVLLIFSIRFLNKGIGKVLGWILIKGKDKINGIKIRNYELLDYDRQVKLISLALTIVKWFLILAIFYTALPVVFGIFPETKSIAFKLINYVLDPLKMIFEAFLGYIPELISILVIIFITKYFVRFLRFLSLEIERGKLIISGFHTDWAKPTFRLVSFIVYVFTFVAIFPYLPGSDSPIFQGVSVFLGLLISMGSSSAIGNMIAGLVITYMRPFKIGDRVKIGDTVGDVIEKTMLVTRLRTIKNEDITIPNSSVLSGQTINFSSSAKEKGLILNTSITIGYDVHWEKVNACLIQAAQQTDNIEKEPLPFVLHTSLDDFYVSYQINAYTKTPEISAKIYSELHANILDVFHNAGIEIMSPHFRAERDGSSLQQPKTEVSNKSIE